MPPYARIRGERATGHASLDSAHAQREGAAASVSGSESVEEGTLATCPESHKHRAHITSPTKSARRRSKRAVEAE